MKHTLLTFTLALLLCACGGGSNPVGGETQATSSLSAAARLGEAIFHDESLSASGRQSCATCHQSTAGHAGASGRAAEAGGADLSIQGIRTTPGIAYLRFNGEFHFDEDDTPTGGFFWDGRAASLQAQAGEPFLNPREMAMPSRAAVVERLRIAAYATEFEHVFGAGILADVERAYERMTFALAQYQREDKDFAAFNSKYDAFLAGRAQLSEQEAQGLALFNAPDKGNCAACHPSERGADGAPPLFTDFTYDALGVPRNSELRVNDDPAYVDLGLCSRADLADRPELCGAFKVPSLRNVAQRRRYFHNGRFTELRDVVDFYVTRDTAPERWYPVIDGVVRKFDDLPANYHGNVNTTEAPYDRAPGAAPALSPQEIDSVVEFLHTLSDDWQP